MLGVDSCVDRPVVMLVTSGGACRISVTALKNYARTLPARASSKASGCGWNGTANAPSSVMVARVATAVEKRQTLPGGTMVPDPLFPSTRRGRTLERWRKPLLGCGILAAVLYVAMTLFVGLWWDGYSVTSQTPSELSAIGAPTRPVWILLGSVYTALMIVFACTVWKSAPPHSALRAVGALLITQSVFGSYWPPMHQRAVLAAGGGTLTDTLHVLWAAVTVILFMFAMGFGAAALGKRFRVYTIATMLIVLACGAWTGTYTSRIQANLPTPGVGVWERINITAFMLWVAVLATALWDGPKTTTFVNRQARPG
jgi:hypothetical protein